MDITVKKINESFCHIECDLGVAQEIQEYFSFLVPGHKFMPTFRQKLWDGFLRLAKFLPNGDLEFPTGLLFQLENFCKDREYHYCYDNKHKSEYSEKMIINYVDSLDIHSNDKKIEIRDYQYLTIVTAIQNKRKVLISPTSSGKSISLYCIIRFLLDHNVKKGLLIVPNVSLCNQIFSDFEDYSSHNNWEVDSNIHTIFSGKEKDSGHSLYISTWQSLQNIKDKRYFHQFDFVISDECHLSSATQVTKIINNCVNADTRIGVTGTLNGTKIHSLQLESLFGPITKVISTKELMDKKQVTELAIKSIVLKYPEEICKELKGFKYQEELQYIISNQDRNKFIKNLVLSLKGNTLLLYQMVEKHGEILFKMISESKYAKDKKVYFIHGNIKAEEREQIRHAMEKEHNVILIGSVGTVSTGTNIRNLHNIIFASPSKSRIRNLQAVGRVLRLSENKTKAILYDIADDLRYKKHTNYTLLHFYERLKIYDEEKFEYKIVKVDLKK